MNARGNRVRELLSQKRPLVMGIINCTPDSFYPGSRSGTPEAALAQALAMAEAGADILDVGGESTRPGSSFVSANEEISRVIPVVRSIRERIDTALSVDTRKAAVAEAALESGADMINDVAALRDDPALGGVVRAYDVPVVLMHMKGTPATMQVNPYYRDPVAEIREELRSSAGHATELGIRKENIILDPGIGFGKRFEDNIALLRHLSVFHELGYPLLVGLSRKGFIGRALDDRPVEGRLAGTLAALAWCVLEGARILRVHDVEETSDLCRMIDLIRGAG